MEDTTAVPTKCTTCGLRIEDNALWVDGKWYHSICNPKIRKEDKLPTLKDLNRIALEINGEYVYTEIELKEMARKWRNLEKATNDNLMGESHTV